MRSLVVPLSLGLGLMTIGTVVADFGAEQRKDFSITRTMSRDGILNVKNIIGAVTVVGVSDGNEIRIVGEKIAKGRTQAEAQAVLEQIEVEVTETGDGLSVRTVVPDDMPSGHSVSYQIQVPRSWGVQVVNANGNVSIGEVRKSASAVVANGSVQLNDVVGDVNVEVANGAIRSTAQVPASGNCRIQTVNGAINATLVVDPSASCDLQTVNGAISLALPNSTSAGVSAATLTGRISVQGLEFTSKQKAQSITGGETFSGTLGGGTGTVKLAATNGGIALKGF